ERARLGEQLRVATVGGQRSEDVGAQTAAVVGLTGDRVFAEFDGDGTQKLANPFFKDGAFAGANDIVVKRAKAAHHDADDRSAAFGFHLFERVEIVADAQAADAH